MKLKILGLALLACAATSAFVVTNASGTVAGHFAHEGPTNNAWITGHDGKNTAHALEFWRLASGTHNRTGTPIVCNTSTYAGTVSAKTVQTIQMFPTYSGCGTKGGATNVTVHVNGCSYTFSSHGTNKHGTVTIDCPTGKAIEITHPECTIKIPAQTHQTTLTEGITYNNVVDGKNSLTAAVTVKTITGHFESGICVFLGTSWKFEMTGSVTVKGYEDLGGTPHSPIEGAQIGIKHT